MSGIMNMFVAGAVAAVPPDIEYLVVAGGGGGGGYLGGGGAGGYRTNTGFTAALNTNYTVTVGAGGAGGTTTGTRGSNGADSVLAQLHHRAVVAVVLELRLLLSLVKMAVPAAAAGQIIRLA